MQCHQFIQTTTRRDMLRASACGFGQLVLAALAGQAARAEGQAAAGPIPPSPAFSAARSANHLPVHVGRAEPR